MTNKQWESFCKYKDTLKDLCNKWNLLESQLFPLQKEAAKKDTPDYKLETAVVYNLAYDEITKDNDIHYIVIGDNPGKDEQKAINRKYFVGQSGKLGAGFFSTHPELGTDFRKNVIITNKTPVHTAKTQHLSYLAKNGSTEIKELILDSQITMAKITAELHQSLIDGCNSNSFVPELWLIGFGALQGKGVLTPYRETLKACYTEDNSMMQSWDLVKVYPHFSMNCFNKAVKNFCQEETNKNRTLKQNLDILGTEYRNKIFK